MSQSNKLECRILLAKNVKNLRLKNNLRREELSLLLGLDNSYISKLEKERINITLDKLSLIADFFGVKIADLFKEKVF
jgi:transcriptional regulator with XRE-family HTH domain